MAKTPHILVADDERSIRMMLETGLTLNGFQVTLARSGQEALAVAERTQVGAVATSAPSAHSDRADDGAGIGGSRGGSRGGGRERFHRQAFRDYGRGGAA